MNQNPFEGFYRLQKKDALRAGAVLAEAFREDPLWKEIFGGAGFEQQRSLFEAPVRYCLRYGQVYAPSDRLEGVITWVSGNLADMTLWRMLVSGAIWPGMLGGLRLSAKMQPIFRPIEIDRKVNMKGGPYLYIPVLGIAPQFQGQGVGGRLLKAIIAESDRARLPVYLETETESNVRWYGGFGFETIRQISLPVIGLPMWEMVRKPAA